MTFPDSIKTCFSKFATFSGRAPLSEYWYWTLFSWIASTSLSIISVKVSWAFMAAALLPSLAVTTRRLHDTNRSGWFQLLLLLPLVGWIALLVFNTQASREPNRY